MAVRHIQALLLVAVALCLSGFAQGQAETAYEWICKQDDMDYFCRIIRTAKDRAKDPVALQLDNIRSTLMVFPPTDRGIRNTIRQFTKYTKFTSWSALARDADASAKFVKAHVVVGATVDTREWRNMTTRFTTALNTTLTAVEGPNRGLFLRSAINDARVLRENIKINAGKGLIQAIEVPLYTR